MARRLKLLSAMLGVAACAGCASAPPQQLGQPPQAIPTLAGSYHQVQRGDTLWRIARSYGLSPHALASANRLPTGGHLAVGQQLFIPLPPESGRFLWPVRGAASTTGSGAGVEIQAARGTLVRASRSGRVAVATRDLSGWGRTVVIDHLDGYLTVYASLEQSLVSPGIPLRQGTPIGNVGGHPLHFEIRYGVQHQNTLTLLPNQ